MVLKLYDDITRDENYYQSIDTSGIDGDVRLRVKKHLSSFWCGPIAITLV